MSVEGEAAQAQEVRDWLKEELIKIGEDYDEEKTLMQLIQQYDDCFYMELREDVIRNGR